MSARGVCRGKPVETKVRVVCSLLFGKEQGESIFIGELRPSGADVVFRCRLSAAVQYDHQWRIDRQAGGNVVPGPQVSGIGAKIR